MRARLCVCAWLVACGTDPGGGSGTDGDTQSSTTEGAGSSTDPQPTTSSQSGSTTAVDSTTDTSTSSADESSTGAPVVCDHSVAPAWWEGHELHAWFEIPDTAGAGGTAIDAFNGMALREATSEIVIAAAGGHHDGADNRVVSLALGDDAPQWTILHESSSEFVEDVAYYPDGLPSARHTYHSTHVIESQDRVFLFGARFVYGSAVEFPTVDAFDLTRLVWDPEGTWASVPMGGNYGAVRVRDRDQVYTSSLFMWSPDGGTWSQPIGTHSTAAVRWPIAHDSSRDELFSLMFADGQGYGDPIVASTRVVIATGTQTDVTLADGDGLVQFLAEAPTYAAMDYDPDNDRFLFYAGMGAAAGRIYEVEAAASELRTIEVLALDASSTLPPGSSLGGVNNRFRYVPALCGFVLLPTRDANLWFIRTA